MVPLRPKNDNNPPPVFFLESTDGSGSSFCFSMTRHPGGRSSSLLTSDVDFTDVSHAADPLDAIYKVNGLLRETATLRLKRSASVICFAVNVLEKRTYGGRVKL